MPVGLGCPGHVSLQRAAQAQAPGRLGLAQGLGEGFEGMQETPVASEAGHHLGHKEDLVGLLHIALELQQG